VWDFQLADYGAQLMQQRHQFLTEISQIAAAITRIDRREKKNCPSGMNREFS
jgi:recombinational DNA repair ATPase RecF